MTNSDIPAEDKLTSGSKKSPTQSPDAGSLVPQAHGGALRHGSLAGTNKGGSGRPREVIRNQLRDLITTKGFKYLEDVLGAPRSYIHECSKCGHGELIHPPKTDEIVLKGIDLCARYGIGTQQEVEHHGTVQLIHDIPERPDK